MAQNIDISVMVDRLLMFQDMFNNYVMEDDCIIDNMYIQKLGEHIDTSLCLMADMCECFYNQQPGNTNGMFTWTYNSRKQEADEE